MLKPLPLRLLLIIGLWSGAIALIACTSPARKSSVPVAYQREQLPINLYQALQNNDSQRVKAILQAGLKLSPVQGNEALLIAVSKGNLANVKALLTAGVNPNETGESILPLRQAVLRNQIPIIKLLLAKGADPNRQDGNTDSIMLHALASNTYLSFLQWDSHPLEYYPTLTPPRLEAVKLLIQAGANPNDRDRFNGMTVLMVVAAHGNLELLKLLIQHGADVNRANKYGETALMYAAWRGYLAVVRELLNQRATVNPTKPKQSRTPLIYAVRRGSPAIVQLLIAKGANVNAASRERTADTNRFAYMNMSVLDHARQTGNATITNLLLRHGAKPSRDRPQ